MQIQSVGIDLGKTTFHLVALGTAGKLLVKKKFTQKQLLAYTANLQTSLYFRDGSLFAEVFCTLNLGKYIPPTCFLHKAAQ